MIPAPVVQIWDEDGASPLGVLAAVSELILSDVFCDMGSLKVTAPKDVVGMELLLDEDDRQVRVVQQGAPDLWFLVDEDSFAWISDDPDSEDVAVTMRSIAGLCEEAKVPPQGGIGTIPAEWAFTAATPGKIFGDLFAAAQARGMLAGVTLAGTATTDATGQSWPGTYTVTYRAGATLLEVLKELSDKLLLEWRFNGRTLELHAPGAGLDRTLDTILAPKRDVTAAPYQRSRRSIATDVIVEGANGATVRRSQTLPGRRRRESYVSATSLDGTPLQTVGDLFLAAHATSDRQMSHDLTDGDQTPQPWRDYQCGDRLPTLAAGDGVTHQRVAQIAMTFGGDDGSSVSLEMGSILQSAEELFASQIRKLGADDA